ncbi:MAG: hypothetical protein Q8Q09_11580 [Deltaproteobacteria bacterium]|nr:hypothetical protein [Deltaproteobacteria bacterium]
MTAGGNSPPDDFAEKFVSDGSPSLFRAKAVAKYHAVMLACAVVALLAGVSVPVFGGLSLGSVALGVLYGLVGVTLAFLWATVTVLRVNVTSESLHVNLGLSSQTIPLASIESIRAVDYPAKKLGGWGIRRTLQGDRALSVMGLKAAVEIRYREGDKTRLFYFTPPDASGCASAIQSAHQVSGTGVRVAHETSEESPQTADDLALLTANSQAKKRSL